VANKRAVVVDRYTKEVGRVWKACGNDARQPAVVEAVWRLAQHAPCGDVLKGTRDLLALMALTKMELAEQRNGKPQGGAAAAAAAAAAADGGRRTKHDDMTVAVVLLPRWMLEENESASQKEAAFATEGAPATEGALLQGEGGASEYGVAWWDSPPT
jgi:hypothetical protein